MADYYTRKGFFPTKTLGKTFLHYTSIDSTQTFLKNKLIEGEAEPGWLVLADHQTTGRGTQGRKWSSLPQPQLMFSLLLRTSIPPQKLPLINILSATIMADVLANYGIQPKIKWPNDIFIDGKKTAGILSELVIHADQPYVILGIGVNTNADKEDFPPELRENITALSMHQPNIDRFRLLEDFLVALEDKIHGKMNPQDIVQFTQEHFRKYWIYMNTKIAVPQNDEVLEGIANEIDPNGALILRTESGDRKIINGSIVSATSIDNQGKNE